MFETYWGLPVITHHTSYPAAVFLLTLTLSLPRVAAAQQSPIFACHRVRRIYRFFHFQILRTIYSVCGGQAIMPQLPSCHHAKHHPIAIYNTFFSMTLFQVVSGSLSSISHALPYTLPTLPHTPYLPSCDNKSLDIHTAVAAFSLHPFYSTYSSHIL